MSQATTKAMFVRRRSDRGLDTPQCADVATQVRDDAGAKCRVPRLIICHDEHVIRDSGEPFEHYAEHGLTSRHKRQERLVGAHAPALAPGERSGAEWSASAGSSTCLSLPPRSKFRTGHTHGGSL